MQTNYYSNHIVLVIDRKGYITSIVSNSHKNIHLSIGDSAIHLFAPHSHQAFYDNFSMALTDNLSLGFRSTLVNSLDVFTFIMKSEQSITLFCIQLHDDVTTLFDEIVQINNEQIRSIRSLYKQVSSNTDSSNFLDEIMLMNNALINTRRELNQKNRQLEKLNHELEEINYTDFLTQMYNRRRFFVDIYEVVKQGDIKLVMMDFNNFKVINDEMGHHKGDELLILFTEEMKNELRPVHATIYRLGGDEFACLFPDTSLIDIDAMFARIDQILQAFHPRIGISYGVVTVTKDTCNKEYKAELSMSIADSQMYEMKKAFHQQHALKDE